MGRSGGREQFLDGQIELTVQNRIALPNLTPDRLCPISRDFGPKTPHGLSYLSIGSDWSADYALYLGRSERWARN